LTEHEWYHGTLSKADADALLGRAAPGTFLVRDSSLDGAFAFSIRTLEGQVRHVLAKPTPAAAAVAGFKFGQSDPRVYHSLPEILTAYRSSQLMRPLPRS
jgi:hypothetical protein